MFQSIEGHPEISELARNWEVVLDELDNLGRRAFKLWPDKHYKGNWKVFPLYKFGKKIEENCLLCPETTRLLEAVPGMTSAGFSSLAPGTHINAHVGYTSDVLRCHLGLKASDNCALRVGDEVKEWEAGACFIFDDTIEHEAWNHGSKTRDILLMDFKKDVTKEAHFPERVYSF